MAAELIPQIEARRREIVDARVELGHLDAELARLKMRLRDGEPRAVLNLDRWNDAEFDRDQGAT